MRKNKNKGVKTPLEREQSFIKISSNILMIIVFVLAIIFSFNGSFGQINIFDTNKLLYEFDAGPQDFQAFGDDGKLLPALQGRTKVYGSTYMHDYGDDKWGYVRAFEEKFGSRDGFIMGTGNHDPQPVRQIAEGTLEEVSVYKPELKKFVTEKHNHKTPAIKPLADELKLNPEDLNDPVKFAKAKHAEPMMAKNHYSFYTNVFGWRDRFDMQGFNTTKHPEKNYAYKVPSNYKEAYHNSLREGFGFNPMDSLEKIFKAKGYDKSNPELYEKIVKYRDILLEEPPKFTKKHKVIIASAAVALTTLALLLKSISKNKNKT